MNNPEQLLRDATVPPTAEIIAEGLGDAYPIYTTFLNALDTYTISLMDWRYYNDGKAWLSKGEYKWVTKRGTQKVKPLFWLSIWSGFFRVAFFFSEKTRADLLSLPLSERAKGIINHTAPSGKSMQYLSIIFDITDDTLLDDIYILSQFRKDHI